MFFLDREAFLFRFILFCALDVAEGRGALSGDRVLWDPASSDVLLASYSSFTASVDPLSMSAETWDAREASLKATNLTGKTCIWSHLISS